jgi:hypothetical protein
MKLGYADPFVSTVSDSIPRRRRDSRWPLSLDQSIRCSAARFQGNGVQTHDTAMLRQN